MPFTSLRHSLPVLGLVAAIAAPAGAADRVVFLETLEAARALAEQDHKPVVLQFGATWCGWCRKMEYETLVDDRVVAAAADFHWVKVDIDEQPVMAARYGVRSVPQTIVTGVGGEPVAARGGFLDAARLLAVLDSALVTARTEAVRDPEVPGVALEQSIERLVVSLSRPQRVGRTEMLDTLRSLGRVAWPGLAARLDDERLAVRAAAAHALARVTGADLQFDPFAPAAARAVAAEAWRRWIETVPPAAGPEPAGGPGDARRASPGSRGQRRAPDPRAG